MNEIDKYITQFPEETQQRLVEMREIIQKTLPDAEEIIKYAMPTYFLKKNLVHFAGYKNHIGFYPVPTAIEAFKNDFAKYKTTKGAVQFPINEKIPVDLVKKVCEFRLKEVLSQ